MSDKRIDHQALANGFIEIVDVPHAQVGVARIAIAQVHATLALVEQQRIANLIALVAVPGDHLESLDRHPDVYDKIREGLGL